MERHETRPTWLLWTKSLTSLLLFQIWMERIGRALQIIPVLHRLGTIISTAGRFGAPFGNLRLLHNSVFFPVTREIAFQRRVRSRLPPPAVSLQTLGTS